MRLSLCRDTDNTSDPDIENMDYFQQMDDKAWRSMGINESNTWFDDTIEDYNKRFREKHKDDICKMECVGDDANICRVMLSNGKVYSQTKFYAGDIIEVCPCREIDKSSLYSKDMRDIVLEVEKNSTFVIPFGYCQYYDVSGYGKEPNCEYHWDKDKKAIVITAKMRIPRHCPLVLDIVSTR